MTYKDVCHGMLRRVVWYNFVYISEVLAACTIRAMMWNLAGQGRAVCGPVGKRVKIE